MAGKGTNKLEYMGDLEMGGYRHDITGGNDGGYNTMYDLNGDGQEVDNWAKVHPQTPHPRYGHSCRAKVRQPTPKPHV